MAKVPFLHWMRQTIDSHKVLLVEGGVHNFFSAISEFWLKIPHADLRFLKVREGSIVNPDWLRHRPFLVCQYRLTECTLSNTGSLREECPSCALDPWQCVDPHVFCWFFILIVDRAFELEFWLWWFIFRNFRWRLYFAYVKLEQRLWIGSTVCFINCFLLLTNWHDLLRTLLLDMSQVCW